MTLPSPATVKLSTSIARSPLIERNLGQNAATNGDAIDASVDGFAAD